MRKKNDSEMPVGRILFKSIRLGLKVKTPISFLVSLLGIPAALFPLLLSRQLQKLTDLLFELTADRDVVVLAVRALVVLGALFLCYMFYGFLAEYFAIKDNYRTQYYIKDYVLRQVCGVHYSYLENRDDFLKRIEFADSYGAVEMSRNIQAIFKVLQQMVTFVSIGVALWAVHPALVGIIIVTSIPAAILSFLQSDETFRHRTKWSEEGHMAIHLFHLCADSNQGIQELRHYELYDYLKARWRAVADNYIFKKNKLTAKHLRVNIVADFLRSAVYLVILLITAKVIYDNPALGLGTFTLVYTLSARLQGSAGMILTEIMKFAVGLSYLKEFFSLEDLEREEYENLQTELRLTGRAEGKAGHRATEQSGDTANQNKVRAESDAGVLSGGAITFDHVSFTYPNSDAEVLHDISVNIRPGEKIAIVGDNGSGKSTFISLLTGMFSPDRGNVSIDGYSVETHKSQLRKMISVIFQDFAHYEGTLRENIAVSDLERKLSDEEIMKLAKSIHVEDVIEEQPEGLNGILGNLSQKGNDLSGGQWQKIALLRAVYRDKTNIMILDEPTAALDPLAEAEMYRNFSKITGDRTTLLISHRLGITKLVDRILVFRDGKIIEDGTHQELMDKRGHYYAMYQAQASWYQVG